MGVESLLHPARQARPSAVSTSTSPSPVASSLPGEHIAHSHHALHLHHPGTGQLCLATASGDSVTLEPSGHSCHGEPKPLLP